MKNIISILFGFLLSIIFIEYSLRYYNPFQSKVKGFTINLQKDVVVKYSGDGVVFDKEIIYRKNSLGLRGIEPPLDWQSKYKIVTVGSSTTESYYISEGKTWSDILHNEFNKITNKVWINNAGMDGSSVFGHTLLLNQYLKNLNINMILYFVGLTDLSIGNNNSRYDEALNRPLMTQDSEVAFIDKISNKSEIFTITLNLYRYLKAVNSGLVPKDAGKMGHSATDFNSLAMYSNVVDKNTENQFMEINKINSIAYYNKLTRLIKMTKDAGIEPALMTQNAVYGCYVDPITGKDMSNFPSSLGHEGKQFNSCITWKFLEMYNEVTRKVAKENDVFIIDLAKELPKSTEWYYDNYHFNNIGSKKAGEIIFNKLNSYLKSKGKI